MKAAFVHRGGPKLASYRLRAEIPAKHIGATVNDGDADIVVFSKPVRADVEVAKQIKGKAAIVVDICDPHDYSAILEYADRVVVASDALKALHPNAVVIGDPLEGEGGDPHASNRAVAWIGHHGNLNGLKAWMDLVRVPVTVCTTAGKWEGAIPWSPESQSAVYRQCGIMLVPAGNEYKSNNRVSQAIHEGCFVIASDIPAYREFRQYAWVGQYPTGIRWVRHSDILDEVVSNGQRYVREFYSAEAIGEKWRAFLASI